MYGLDLFSGIGGISLALERLGVRTVAYCESDRYAQGVLLSRMQSGELNTAPIWDDVKTLRGEMLPQIDIIFGGFPCQDISCAGSGKGLAGERSSLFYEIIRLTKEIIPSFVFLENVPAIRARGLREVVRAFTEIGYDCRWTCVSAASVGAKHKRERWFLLAHPPSKRLQRLGIWEKRAIEKFDDSCYDSRWEIEPDVGRVANGVPLRVDRIKCLGNSVVPKQVEKAFKMLAGLE